MKKDTGLKVGIAGLAAAALVLALYPKFMKAKGVSGTFEGTAKGLGGDVVVTLTLKDSVITDVKVKGDKETPSIGGKAMEQLPPKMVEGNTIKVDVVTTATITSNAIIEATKNALINAGLDPKDYQKEAKAEVAKDMDITTDVVVVGAGGAGMSAAIVAANEGRDVVILESMDVAGGNSVRSTGGMNAADTPYEDSNEFAEGAGVEKTLSTAKEKYADNKAIQDLVATVEKQYADYQANPQGYFDSAELMELDTLVGGKGINNPDLVKTLSTNSADAIEWLSSIGADLKNVGQFGGASVKRIHRPVDENGKVTAVGSYMVPILEKNLEKLGIQVIYNATADEIKMKDGKVAGVHAKGKDGNDINVTAKAVILATGGFGANNDMVKEQNPALDGYITTNATGAQGQGITMATAKGIDAAVVDMKQIQLHPTVNVDDKKNAHLITEGLRGDGAILVNQSGKRFIDEVGTRDVVSAAENEQEGGYAYLIIDQSMVDKSAVIQGYINNGYTTKGETYEELAKNLKMDEATFANTMNTWNSYVDNNSDLEFNRTSFVKKLDAAPYYAIKVQPGIHHTMGGLVINSNTEVQNTSGKTIPGLYAAGEVTGGVHGANRLGGNAVADFVVFGRIAGQQAAAYAK